MRKFSLFSHNLNYFINRSYIFRFVYDKQQVDLLKTDLVDLHGCQQTIDVQYIKQIRKSCTTIDQGILITINVSVNDYSELLTWKRSNLLQVQHQGHRTRIKDGV